MKRINEYRIGNWIEYDWGLWFWISRFEQDRSTLKYFKTFYL